MSRFYFAPFLSSRGRPHLHGSRTCHCAAAYNSHTARTRSEQNPNKRRTADATLRKRTGAMRHSQRGQGTRTFFDRINRMVLFPSLSCRIPLIPSKHSLLSSYSRNTLHVVCPRERAVWHPKMIVWRSVVWHFNRTSLDQAPGQGAKVLEKRDFTIDTPVHGWYDGGGSGVG